MKDATPTFEENTPGEGETVRRAILLLLLLGCNPPTGQAPLRCSSASLLRLLHNKSPDVVNSIEKEWARAYAERDAASLNCIFADEFQITSPGDPDFQVHYKSDVLQWVASRKGSAELEELRSRSHDSAATARGVYAVRSEGRLLSRFQFVDFFIYQDNRWQVLVRVLTELPVK